MNSARRSEKSYCDSVASCSCCSVSFAIVVSFRVRDLLAVGSRSGCACRTDLRSQILIVQRRRNRRALWLRRRPARAPVRKIATVVSHSPAPRFGAGKGKISTRSIGRRRRLTGIRTTSLAGVARLRVRRAVQHRRNQQQRRGAEDHQHEHNDARLLRDNVQCGAPDQHRQNSGSTKDREHNTKAETRSPLLTVDLSSDVHRRDQHYRERQCPHNHVHDSGTLTPTPRERLNTSRARARWSGRGGPGEVITRRQAQRRARQRAEAAQDGIESSPIRSAAGAMLAWASTTTSTSPARPRTCRATRSR
jgi:hypothetical protein